MVELNDVYHRLPYPLKVLAASMRGWQLRRWRYGKATAGLVDDGERRERWDIEDIESWQHQRLRELLQRAAHQVPHYQQVLGLDGTGRGTVPALLDWPVLRKNELRSGPTEFLVDGANHRSMFPLRTSGSTATPLQLWINGNDLKQWYALAEARWRRWYGVSRWDHWAIFGGRVVTRPGRKTPPYWVWNGGMRQLYLSAYHIDDQSAVHYLRAMARLGIVYLLGYPSAIFDLASRAERLGLEAPDLSVIVSNAEPLLPNQRETIERFFNCPVRNTYGMAEMVAAAGECEHGTMHLWPEAGFVEVVDDDDRPVPRGDIGRLLCTGLINTEMPLIRYDIGDRGALSPESERCPCGRNLPILQSIEGRLDDIVVAPDGRKIGRLDTVFKADLPIREAQIVQDSCDSLIVNLVPVGDFDSTHSARIVNDLRARVGAMKISVEMVDAIPRGPNGKFRSVINRVAQAGL